MARPSRKTKLAVVVGNATGDGRDAARRHDDEAAVDESDEQDEQADAHADRALEGKRDRVHDRFAETGQHEDRDDDALEHDDAHRAGEGQALAEHEGEGDHAVDPEARGQRQRIVRNDAHQDRHHTRGQRGRRRRRRHVDPGRRQDRRVQGR